MGGASRVSGPAAVRARAAVAVVLAAVVALSGCATYTARQKGLVDRLAAGDYDAALSTVEKNRRGKDLLLYWLEKGLILHYADRWQESNAAFEAGEQLAADLYTKSLSEAALSVTFSPPRFPPRTVEVDPRRLAEDGAVTPGEREVASVGIPVPGVEVEVRGRAGAPLPEGRLGRIFVRSPSLMREYLGQPEATRAALEGGAHGLVFASGLASALGAAFASFFKWVAIEHAVVCHFWAGYGKLVQNLPASTSITRVQPSQFSTTV